MASGGESNKRKSVTLYWRVENIAYWEQGFHPDIISSPGFDIQLLGGIRCHLKLFPKVKDSKNICLLLTVSNVKSILLDCEFSLLHYDDSVIMTSTARNREFSCDGAIEMPDCPAYDEVFINMKSIYLIRDTLIVRCRIWKSDSNFPAVESFISRSLLEVEQKRFEWKMSGLSEMKTKNQKTILEHVRFNKGDKMFEFVGSFVGDSLQDSELNIKMRNVTLITKIEFIKLKVSILDRDQKAVRSTETSRVFNLTNAYEYWILPELVTRKELLETNSPLMCGDVLYLLFEFSILCKEIVNVIDRTYIITCDTEQDNVSRISNFSEVSIHFEEMTPLQSPSDDIPPRQSPSDDITPLQSPSDDITPLQSPSDDIKPLQSPLDDMPPLQFPSDDMNGIQESLDILSEDMYSMYLDRKFTDFVLHSEGVEYPVHKNILYSRSGFFRDLFSSTIIRPDLSTWDMADVDKCTLNQMIIFLYTGSMAFDLPWEGVVQLYIAAHTYRVSSLLHQCSVVLQSMVSAVKVIDALIIANRYGDEELRSVVNEFLLIHFDEITMSEQWKRFAAAQPRLAANWINQLNEDRIQDNMTKETKSTGA